MKRNDDEATNLKNLETHRHRNASIMYAGSRVDDLDKKAFSSLHCAPMICVTEQTRKTKKRKFFCMWTKWFWPSPWNVLETGTWTTRVVSFENAASCRESWRGFFFFLFWEPKKIPGNSKSKFTCDDEYSSVCLLLRKTLRQYWFDKIFDFVWSSKRFHLHKLRWVLWKSQPVDAR